MRHRSIITAVLVAGTLTAAGSASAQDLRSPGARRTSGARCQAACTRTRSRPADGAHRLRRPGQIVVGDDPGFDFGSATVGAIAALVLAGAGVGLTLSRRRRTAAPIA